MIIKEGYRFMFNHYGIKEVNVIDYNGEKRVIIKCDDSKIFVINISALIDV